MRSLFLGYACATREQQMPNRTAAKTHGNSRNFSPAAEALMLHELAAIIGDARARGVGRCRPEREPMRRAVSHNATRCRPISANCVRSGFARAAMGFRADRAR